MTRFGIKNVTSRISQTEMYCGDFSGHGILKILVANSTTRSSAQNKASFSGGRPRDMLRLFAWLAHWNV